MIFGVIGIQAFNLVDTFFVGKLGVHELAAMSFTFPVVFIVGGISLGLGLGASALISRAIGEGDWHRVQRLTTDSLSLAVLIVALFVAVGLLTIDPVFRLLGASDDLLPLIRQYMTVWYPGMLFVVFPMVGNNAIRATGDTKTPGVIMMIAALANGGLDPLFIFGIGPFPRLELAGAALATVIGRSITFTVALWVLGRRDRMLTLKFPGFAAVWESWRGILYIGLPSALTNIVVPLGVGFITRIVSGYGAAAVAGFGVASRVETFSFTFVMALRTVVAPFVGQNWGARKFARLARGIQLSHGFAVVWGALMLVLLGAFARPVASVFNSAPGVVATTALYLWIVPLSYGLRGVHFVATAALSVLHRPIDAAVLTLVQFFGLYFPLALLGSRLLGLKGVFGAGSIANIVAGALAYVWLRRIVAMRTQGA
jgi:putative MATE family efflux protein